MIYYINILISPLLLSLSLKNKKRINSKILFVCSMILPVILLTFRDLKIGTDTLGYAEEIQQFANGISYNGVEWLYYFTGRLGCLLFKGYRGAFFLFALITVWSAYKAIANYQKQANPFLCAMFFLCFVYPWAFNGTRQIVACSLVMLASSYYQTEDKKKFYVILLCAILFHTSSIVALFIPMITRVSKASKHHRIIFLCIIIGFQIISGTLFSYAQKIPLFRRYMMNYGTLNYVLPIQLITYFFNSLTRLLPPFLVIIYFLVKGVFKNEKKEKEFYPIACMGFIYIFSSTYDLFATYISRLGLYFAFSVPMLMANFEYYFCIRLKLKKFNCSLWEIICILYFIFYFYYTVVFLGYQQIYPFVWGI